MTALIDVVLYTPGMWNDLFSKHRLDVKTIENTWKAQTGKTLLRKRFDVEQSGLKTKAYDRVEAECASGSHLPIIILPIGHCAENIDARELAVIGPAIGTRNDIFVFRSLKKPPPGTPAEDRSELHVAVREAELTTSNISRVVLHHARADTLFPREGNPAEWFAAEQFEQIWHKPLANTESRARAVIEGRVHAAIFMGRELSTLKKFEDELIDAANLNLLANNLYNVQLFPRALYVTFRRCIDRAEGMETARAFSNTLNERVRAYQSKRKENADATFERRTQQPCLTGSEALPSDVTTVTRFTEHMLDRRFRADREKGSIANPLRRALRTDDFIFYDDIAAPQMYEAKIDTLRRIDVKTTFYLDSKNPSFQKMNDKVKTLCDRLGSDAPCRDDQLLERVKAVALNVGFTRGESELLASAYAKRLRGPVKESA